MSNTQRRINIFNLDTSISNDTIEPLRSEFSKFGEVQNCFVTKPGTGIVTMKDVKDVQSTIAGMNGFRFMGSTITLSQGNNKKSNKSGSSGGASGSNNNPFGPTTGGWGGAEASSSATTASTSTPSATFLAPAPRLLSNTAKQASTSNSMATANTADGINGVTDSLAGLQVGGQDTWELSLEDSDFDDGYRPPQIDKKPPPIQKQEWDEAYSFLKSFAHYGGSVLAVDVESWDQDHDYIIELGVAYVTWKKGNMAAPRVKVEHIIIQEHEEKRNGVYSADAKDLFTFGRSKILTEFESQVHIRVLMNQLGDGHPLIMLFHNATAEKSYFELMGIEELKNCPERVPHRLLRPTPEVFRKGEWSGSIILDTQRLWQAYLAGKPNAKKAPLGLGKICSQLNITTKYLHNAGNDAAYTLMVLTKLAQIESRAQQEQNRSM